MTNKGGFVSNLEISTDRILELLWFVILLPVIIGLVAIIFVISLSLMVVPVLFLAAPVIVLFGIYKLIEWGTM